MKSVIKLKIADIIIELRSPVAMKPLNKKESWRFDNFIYKKDKRPHIVLEVKIVDRLPKVKTKATRLFITVHPKDKKANWALFKKDGVFLLRQYLSGKNQLIILNKDFKRGLIFIKQKAGNWKLEDIIYDALQIILINYLTNNDGIFVHAVGLKDIDKTGLLFIGKSGFGKSTTARLWHKFSKAKVLNDDRIIIRKNKGTFLMHSSPWHGDFSDYLVSKVESVKIKSIFFLSHGKINSAKRISVKRAFNLLFPCLFTTFWDKGGLIKAIDLSQAIIKNSACFSLAFRNDKEVIGFVRTRINAI